MNKVLDILDNMEEIRQKAAERPADYPVDYTIRLLTSIVAQAYGYQSRNAWTDELKEHPESRYARRLSENAFHV